MTNYVPTRSSDDLIEHDRRWHPRQRRRGGRSRHAPRRGAYRYCDRGWRLRVPSALPETLRPPPGSAERAANLRADTRVCREYLDKVRSEEHPSALQSLMRLSYSVLCLTKTT